MKTTVDIPIDILNNVVFYSKSKNKKTAIITAMQEYIQKKKMEEFANKKLGKLENLITGAELKKLRQKK